MLEIENWKLWQKVLLAIGISCIGLAILIGWMFSRFMRYVRDGRLESALKDIGNTYTESIKAISELGEHRD